MLMTDFDHDDVIGSLRRAVETVLRHVPLLRAQLPVLRRAPHVRVPLRRLPAVLAARATSTSTPTRSTHYHVHLERPRGEHIVLAASEQLTEEEPWIEMEQDELLVCDPDDADHPRVERLLGDRADDVEFVAAGLGRAERRRARRVGGEAGGQPAFERSEPRSPAAAAAPSGWPA